IYSLGLMNGLEASRFTHGTGIGDGKGEGNFANANNLALTASLKAFLGDCQVQASGYASGTIGSSKYAAARLGIPSGAAAAPLFLGEANIQYYKNGISAKALGAYIHYPSAGEINRTYANNTPSSIYGFYAELGYNFF